MLLRVYYKSPDKNDIFLRDCKIKQTVIANLVLSYKCKNN